ncbi:Integrin alpha-6 VLA-6 [Triplophysa tibetana]|uniref:Integrin alpha-6 VLA-6 n=1 Tax=Triplophysa tibetana TaxID=1572043 RepID=A0A5A9NII7_9TELE|nr:Integrin alpha-6 VLA-6 [Triplophysa tibetana]
MISQHWGLAVTVWLLTVIQQISSFNLDTQSVIKKRGDANTLFGFSMAMHQQLQPTDERFLLIGAPRAKALSNQGANITGGLYRCKFNTRSDDCERIVLDVDVRENTDGKDHKENQWLGVSVKSQGPGGHVVTCAHRYQDWSFGNQLVLGRCFVMKQDLKLEEKRSLCHRRKVDKHMFGYCQQGISVAFTRDGKYVIFGAPGAYEWKGTVQMEPVVDFLLDTFETGDKNREELIPVDISSYLGFAVDSGINIVKKGELIVVAGAPRSGHSGEVVLLKPDKKSESKTMRAEHILRGPELASSFGYDLVVLDLNSDGWDDLVVGAPQFSLQDMDEDVGGAVFVYINKDGGQQWDRIKPVALYGKRDSMFGLAVAHTGDMNQDGYQDFAVSSPYEDSGKGRVYVYHGSPEGFRQKPQQVLQARDNDIKLFGYALASNMDVDNNGYPDLAVGSGSDSVLIYRSKPVVNIEKSLTLTPDRIDLKKRDCKANPCFITARSCFTYTAQPATYNPKMRIEYSLAGDTLHRERDLPQRVVFIDPTQRLLELPAQGQEQCVETKLKLQGDIQDKLTSILIDLSVSMPSDTTNQTFKNLPDLQPVLNTLKGNTNTAEFIFLNDDCGSDNICQSNLHVQYTFCTKDQHQDKCNPLSGDPRMPVISPGDENVALEVTVTNKGGEDAHNSQLSVMFPEYLPLSSIVPKSNSKTEVNCKSNENRTLAHCNLENPFKRDSNTSFYLILKTDRLSDSVTGANVTMSLKTLSIQNIPQIVAEAKILIEMHLEVSGLAKPSQLFVGGDVRDEKTIKKEDDIGSLVLYEFRISNTGRPMKSFDAVLNIQWPKETKKGKRLLYLVQVTGRGQKIIQCTPSEAINPLKNIKALSRGRREVGHEPEQEALSNDGGFLPFLGNSRKYKILTCADELECVMIQCPLEAVDSTAVIVLHSRLSNSTFLGEYSSLNYLDIVLDASLSLNGTVRNIGIRPSETKVRLTVFPEKKPALLSRVPWWVIFLSVLTALMLAAMLGYLVWKLYKSGLCGGKKNV